MEEFEKICARGLKAGGCVLLELSHIGHAHAVYESFKPSSGWSNPTHCTKSEKSKKSNCYCLSYSISFLFKQSPEPKWTYSQTSDATSCCHAGFNPRTPKVSFLFIYIGIRTYDSGADNSGSSLNVGEMTKHFPQEGNNLFDLYGNTVQFTVSPDPVRFIVPSFLGTSFRSGGKGIVECRQRTLCDMGQHDCWFNICKRSNFGSVHGNRQDIGGCDCVR